jgi:hypothetical protein
VSLGKLISYLKQAGALEIAAALPQLISNTALPQLGVRYQQKNKILKIEVFQKNNQFVGRLPIRIAWTGGHADHQIDIAGCVARLEIPLAQFVQNVILDPGYSRIRKLIYQHGGDLNGDGIKDGLDMMQFGEFFGSRAGGAGYWEHMDSNNDGRVDNADLKVFEQSMPSRFE